MADAKHTPGPWQDGKDSQGRILVFQSRSEFGEPNEEWQANLRLLDAAPELLSLLQDAVDSFGPHLEGGDDEWLKFARAAITKVTGSAA